MRLSSSRITALTHRPQQDFPLWDKAGTRPSLDLQFADRKDLVDATTGSNLIDFTRASSATYVGSDGLIKTATTNLVLQSEDLTVSPWSTAGSVAITADSSQGVPFSGASVYKIEFSGADESINQFFTYLATQYTASIWVKGTPGEVIRFSGKTGQAADNFTLNGTWQRLAFVGFTATAGAANFNLNTFGAATARVVYAAAPQLEQSDTVGEYVKTTSTINSAPRFDHDPTTGESLGLLVEESRTNLLTYSEDYENAAWQTTNPGEVTLIPGVADPAGGNNATTFYYDSGAGDTGALRRLTAGTSGQPYTFSLWARRRIGSGNLKLVVGDNVAQTLNGVTSTWKRFAVSYTPTSNTVRTYIALDNAGDQFDIWGAQLEEGSFPTSYIPTEGSTVTRAADVASISGSNFSSWYRQDEGTIYQDNALLSSSWAGGVAVDIGAGGAFGTTEYAAWNGTSWNLQPNTAPINVGSSVTTSSTAKFAAGIATNNSILAANSLLGVVDTLCNVPSSPTTLTIGARGWSVAGTSNYLNGTIRRLVYWGQRLPNSTLQAITQ